MIRAEVFTVKRGWRRRKARRIFWGIALIIAGVVLLLERFGMVDLGHVAVWWTWWPALVIVGGLAALVAPDDLKDAAKGLSTTLLGFWALACMQHWYGMTWSRSWPLALVIVGLEAILIALSDRGSKAEVVTDEEVPHV
jgi:uncharacterized membrane protein HdeD (DUF308 family)